MELNKRQKQLVAILLVVAVAFSICVFCIPFRKNGTFWIAYIAELLALVLQIPVFKLAYDNAQDLKSKVLGFPVFRVGYLYLGIQSVTSIILFVLATVFKSFPVFIPVSACILILAGAIVCSIAADIAREEVEKIEYAQKKDTALIKELRVKTQNILSKAYDDNSKHMLELIADSFRYSDPVSNQSTYEIELRLKNKITELDKSVSAQNDITELCAEISGLLKNRNDICKMSKH